MVIYGVYIVSKSGGLIFNHDHNIPKIETEKTFSFPLDIKLLYENKKVVVAFGQRDGIMGIFKICFDKISASHITERSRLLLFAK
jgi:hypothetical protein